jgi:hypothetical protein
MTDPPRPEHALSISEVAESTGMIGLYQEKVTA